MNKTFWKLFSAIIILTLLFSSVVVYPQNYWEPDIKKFEAADSENPPPKGAVLFVGSSSIRMWKSVADDFPFVETINRGFGGSEMSDLVYFADRIILPYEPALIVVYSGDNDIANGKKPETIVNDFRELVEIVNDSLPGTPIILIPPKPSLSRWKWQKEYKETKAQLKQFIEVNEEKNLVFVDVFSPMLNEQGEPRQDIFLDDQLHLNKKGYDLWEAILEPVIKKHLRKKVKKEQ